ncbi:MAG: helix-turn-helix transcriptional regulator [Lachnospiraceae bacterium]|nr:helix-turn-helix transcriptional regulator [Lachnospiraceae bacterium]
MDEIAVLDRIRSLCRVRNWSLYRLSKESDIPSNTLYNMMSRTTTPTISTILKLCDGFGITPSQFFREDETEWPELTQEQLELLQRYDQIDDRKKELLLTYLRGLSE